MRLICVMLGFCLLLFGCGVGSGPYSSEGQLISALERQIKKECRCGEARYKYFSSGQESNVSGCGKVGKNTSKILERYRATPGQFITARSEALRIELVGCWRMD